MKVYDSLSVSLSVSLSRALSLSCSRGGGQGSGKIHQSSKQSIIVFWQSFLSK